MELKNISDCVAYIPNASNIGVIKDGNECTLVDSGLDAETGKKILALLSQQGIKIKNIINTHSHADHCGGNKFIKEKTNCEVYAPRIEASFIENPILEPACFFSGANPINNLKNKFFMAEPCKVDKIIDGGELKIGQAPIQIVPLPGHSINQMGIAVEGTFFCADSFFSKETIEKHKIPFFTNIEETKKTLNAIKEMNYKLFIPSHLQPQTNLVKIIEENLQAIENLEANILKLSEEEKSTEQILKELCCKMELKISSVQQYYLLKTAIMAYLECLCKKGQLKIKIEKNILAWEKT